MASILKIDNFARDNKIRYGLVSGGSCYAIKDSFYLDILGSYEITDLQKPETVKCIWSRVKCQPGDTITVSNSGCFIEFKDFDGFVECRPTDLDKEGNPDFSKFPEEFLNRIGTNMLSSRPMSMEDRKKITIIRI